MPVPVPVFTQTLKLQPNCDAGSGSSSATTASERAGSVVLLLIRRLVILIVPSVTEILTDGTASPAAVGVPPVQVMTKSPINAVISSPGTWLGTPPLAIHVNGSVCALAVTDKPSRRARTASTGIILRK